MTDVQRPAEPVLSILIPAYNFPGGIRRALDSLGDSIGRADLEVIVSDDSSSSEQAARIEQIVARTAGATYRRNATAKGAVPHWNALLGQARGRHCLLLHHDEYLESPAVLEEVLRRLASSDPPDAIVLSCKVVGPARVPRRNMPVAVAEHVVSRWPGYLFRRNVLGAPSVLILRRSMYEPFDERLRWLVDVELYARVVTRHHPTIEFLAPQGVVSDASLPTSITATLGSDVTSLRCREVGLLRDSGGLVGRGVWLLGQGFGPRIARGVETALWAAFRAGHRTGQAFVRAWARPQRVPLVEE